MSKFAARPTNVRAPITTTDDPILTREGGRGHARDARSELFLLAASNMVSEDTFYEDGQARDKRFETLVGEVTRLDPEWVAAFVPYLRNTMQMRSASIVVAAEYVKAGGPHGRRVVDSALARGDEPAEMLAYWHSQYGRRVPKPVKRGVADAARRLYTERASLRYDGTDRPWRMADVIELAHPKPVGPWQSNLFRLLLDKRHHHDERTFGDFLERAEGFTPSDAVNPPAVLPILLADRRLRSLPESERRAAITTEDWTTAGWSHERASGWIPGGMDRAAWEALIPQMGYMALLRNLRNFDEAGVTDEVAATVMAKLTDPDEVARSRQFPIRFLAAYKAVNSLRWAYALKRALNLTLTNVPALPGRTLLMIDVSGSMTHERFLANFHRGWRDRNKFTMPWEHAAIFGLALAARARAGGHRADVWTYGDRAARIDVPKAASLLPLLEAVRASAPFQTGTQTLGILAALVEQAGVTAYDRVVILTDEQAFDAGARATAIIDAVPLIYTFNIGGLKAGHLPSGERGRYTFAGLTDAAFQLLPAIEGRRDGAWPFEVDGPASR